MSQSFNILSSLLPQIASIVAEDTSIPNPALFRRNFLKGGVAGTKSIEAEGKEVVQAPGQKATKLKGPSHKAGGIDLEVTPGTVIYSDKVKGPDGRSMADRKISRDRLLKKFADALKENKADAIHKATAVRGMETLIMQELSDIETMQDEFEKTNQKGKVKAQTGYVVPPMSGFEGKPPRKRMVLDGYDWQAEFDPYYFQRAYFQDDKSQWDNKVGDLTTKAMGTPEGQSIMEALTRMHKGQSIYGDEAGRNPDEYAVTPGLPNQTIDPIQTPKAPLPGASNLTPFQDYTFDSADTGLPATGDATATLSGGEGPTAGDMAAVGAPIAKTLITVLNRLGDKPTPNYAQGIGDEELRLASKGVQGAAESRDIEMQRNNALLNTLRMNRGGRSINANRAYDIGVLTEAQKNAGKISSTYNAVLRELTARQGALSTRRDQVQAEGRKFADITDEQNRDAFATNLSTNVGDIAAGIQHKEMNQLRRKLGVTGQASEGADYLASLLSQYLK